MADSVSVGVITSGDSRISITAGKPLARACSNAGMKSAVFSTTAPKAPKERAKAAKSGLVRAVPCTRAGYSRS